MVNGKANWQARDFLACDACWLMGRPARSFPGKLNKVGPPRSPGRATITPRATTTTDVNLAPGFVLTNTWDAHAGLPGIFKAQRQPPVHSCGNHMDTRNNPGLRLRAGTLHPFNKLDRRWGNGILSFTPDFSNDAFLKSFLSTENVKYAGKALVPAEAGKPAAVVVRLASPYVMVKASGEAAGADKVEVSVDGGKTFKAVELKNFDHGGQRQHRRLGQGELQGPADGVEARGDRAEQSLRLPYLSPGKNTVTVSVADPEALGNNRLVVTYAYRLGSREPVVANIVQAGQADCQPEPAPSGPTR